MKHTISLPNSEIERRIAENIHNQKYRDIMRMRYIDGLTYERIAELSEMTPRYVRGLVKRLSRHIMPEQKVLTEICYS